MKVYQHVDELNKHDGIGNDIQGFHSLFQRMKISNAIVTRLNHTESKENLEILSPFQKQKFYPDDIHILHYGGTGYPLKFFDDLSGRKWLRFHNMTPVSFFKKYLPPDLYKTFDKNEVKSNLELYSLHSKFSHVLHDSEFNKTEYTRIIGDPKNVKMTTLPIVRQYSFKKKEITNGFHIGFIGRLVPNKKIEDLLFTLYFLRKIDSRYKLLLIGKKSPIFDTYYKMLFQLIKELNLGSAVEIFEHLNDANLVDKLSELDIYLSMSEHEGFGIPILEAMGMEIPILAYSSTAILETVKDAGILFNQKDFPKIAELIHVFNSNPSLRSTLLATQSKRFQSYNNFPFEDKIRQLLQSE